MAEKLDNIFNECLDRILQGESIESCLQRYPQEAAHLEPLLRTAFGFNWRSRAIKPRPEFKAQARAKIRLQAAQLHATQVKQPQHTGFFTWQRAWAVALTAILLFVFTGAGTVAACSGTLPDQPLYQVKLATEEVRLAFAGSDVKKAELHAQLAENRATEIAAMARQGKTDQIVATTNRLIEHLAQAEAAIAKVEQQTTTVAPQPTLAGAEATTAPTATTERSLMESSESDKATQESQDINELNQAVTASTSKSLETLEQAMDETPSQAKAALQQAIKAISEKKGKKQTQKTTIENQNQEKEQEKEKEKEKQQEQNQEHEQEQQQDQNQESDQTQKQQTTQESEVEQNQNQEQNQEQNQNQEQEQEQNQEQNHDSATMKEPASAQESSQS